MQDPPTDFARRLLCHGWLELAEDVQKSSTAPMSLQLMAVGAMGFTQATPAGIPTPPVTANSYFRRVRPKLGLTLDDHFAPHLLGDSPLAMLGGDVPLAPELPPSSIPLSAGSIAMLVLGWLAIASSVGAWNPRSVGDAFSTFARTMPYVCSIL